MLKKCKSLWITASGGGIAASHVRRRTAAAFDALDALDACKRASASSRSSVRREVAPKPAAAASATETALRIRAASSP